MCRFYFRLLSITCYIVSHPATHMLLLKIVILTTLNLPRADKLK